MHMDVWCLFIYYFICYALLSLFFFFFFWVEPGSSFEVHRGSYVLEPCNTERKTNATIFWQVRDVFYSTVIPVLLLARTLIQLSVSVSVCIKHTFSPCFEEHAHGAFLLLSLFLFFSMIGRWVWDSVDNCLKILKSDYLKSLKVCKSCYCGRKGFQGISDYFMPL